MIQSKQNEQAIKIGNWLAPRLEKYETILFLVLLFTMIIKAYTNQSINTLIVLTLIVLAVLYFFNSFATTYFDNAGSLDIFLHKLASWGCSLGIMGILFRLQSWSGHEQMIWVGCGSILIILLFILYRKSQNAELKLFNSRYILRIILICSIGFILVLAPKDVLVKSKVIGQPTMEVLE